MDAQDLLWLGLELFLGNDALLLQLGQVLQLSRGESERPTTVRTAENEGRELPRLCLYFAAHTASFTSVYVCCS